MNEHQKEHAKAYQKAYRQKNKDKLREKNNFTIINDNEIWIRMMAA